MSPRTGRPPSDNPKIKRVEIRLTSEDSAILEYCCKVTGRTKSELVRDGIHEIYASLGNSGEK